MIFGCAKQCFETQRTQTSFIYHRYCLFMLCFLSEKYQKYNFFNYSMMILQIFQKKFSSFFISFENLLLWDFPGKKMYPPCCRLLTALRKLSVTLEAAYYSVYPLSQKMPPFAGFSANNLFQLASRQTHFQIW